MSLATALAGLVQIPQFFVWRLQWDAAENKFHKTPATPEGPWIVDASLPRNWLTYAQAAQRVVDMQSADASCRYALGFWLTGDLGYWFLDIDKCFDPLTRTYTPIALELAQQCPGCLMELSSSGNGLHIIGKGVVPHHSMRNKENALELYTEQRGIAFGLSWEASGSADHGSAAIASIAAKYFPPRAVGADDEWMGPRVDWSGPVDDDALLSKALASASVASKMGNRATFRQLFEGAPELARFYGEVPSSEADAALASHLAFWTGCDAPRMERLMRRSALARPKWDEHRTYLRELTIPNACAIQKDVYKEAPRMDPGTMYAFGALPALPTIDATGLGGLGTTTLMVSPEAKALIDGLLDMIHGSTSWDDVHNRVIPAVRAAGVPSALMSRIENAINKRLDLWDAKLPVAKLRALLNPPRVAGGDDEPVVGDAPEWIGKYVYVTQNDKFHDVTTGLTISRASFGARHDRDMPIKGDGPLREDAATWALQRWGCPLVHDTVYYPGKPGTLLYEGLEWANLYSDQSHPEVAAYTADGVAAIERFQRHMWELCGKRERVYLNLISFMAHNVQFPGRKIRWLPIIKGTNGDGKTIVGRVMDAAMGGRNVSSIGPEIITNSGGFTDWAHGNAFVALEEMYLQGKDRYRIANALLQYISNEKVSIHGKGDKPKKVPNTCNYIAFTNYSDAVPIDAEKDRRWFVIFTPFSFRPQMWAALGLNGVVEATAHFDAMFHSLEREPGQWRRWLMEWQIPAWFSADSEAMTTDEKASMGASGVDDVESMARSIVAEGAFGVSDQVLSSSMFSSALKQRAFAEGVEPPKGISLHHLLNRMGFEKMGRAVKWNNAAHWVWAKPGVDKTNDNVRSLLEATKR